MEYHYFFLNEILGALGLGHFAHEYQHVLHSWLVMVILIVSAILFARGLQLLPRKGQNIFEVILVEVISNSEPKAHIDKKSIKKENGSAPGIVRCFQPYIPYAIVKPIAVNGSQM